MRVKSQRVHALWSTGQLARLYLNSLHIFSGGLLYSQATESLGPQPLPCYTGFFVVGSLLASGANSHDFSGQGLSVLFFWSQAS